MQPLLEQRTHYINYKEMILVISLDLTTILLTYLIWSQPIETKNNIVRGFLIAIFSIQTIMTFIVIFASIVYFIQKFR